MNNASNQGFTLIELLIVIAIIGILATVLIPGLLGARKRAYDSAAISCAKSLELVQGMKQMDTGQYAMIGSSAGEINKTTDGVHSACSLPDMFIADRSDPTQLTTAYEFDVWHRQGSRVVTVSPSVLDGGAAGATAFSPTGAGGSNLP